MPMMIRFATLAAAALLAAPGAHAAAARLGKFCESAESCKTFCRKHCKLNKEAWTVSCNLPSTALEGALDPKLSVLQRVPSMKLVQPVARDNKCREPIRATPAVVAGLIKFDAQIAATPGWPKGHTARVKNCYRPARCDAEEACSYIVKGWHILDKWAGKTPQTEKEKKELADGKRYVEPKKLGLTWPGATPHSSGKACDIVIVDPKGKELTACKMSGKKQQALSKALVDAITNDKVGALRLNYEGWHFEWGGTTDCRCKGDDCNDNHWPTACSSGHCAKP